MRALRVGSVAELLLIRQSVEKYRPPERASNRNKRHEAPRPRFGRGVGVRGPLTLGYCLR